MDGREGLVFAHIGHNYLLIGKCPNKHLHIFGFAHQLDGHVDLDSMTMTTTAACFECGLKVTRVDKLAWSNEYVSGGLGI